MDLNYLLTRHQTSLMRADRAACAASRLAHSAMAHDYAIRIRAMQRQSGALSPLLPNVLLGELRL